MRVGSIKSTAFRQTGFAAEDVAPAAQQSAGRAMFVVEPPEPSSVHSTPTRYLQAAFLAQLLAIKQDLPQMRERRRAAPADALAAYRATATLLQ